MNKIFKINHPSVNTFVQILIDNKKISNISFEETGMNSFGYENINEVFFDVYEIKTKEFETVKEKRGEFNGFPIIEMDLTVDDKIFKNVRFILKEQNEISVNPNLLDYTTAIVQEGKTTKKPSSPKKKGKAKTKTLTENYSSNVKTVKKNLDTSSGAELIENNKQTLLTSLKEEVLKSIKQEMTIGVISEMMKTHLQSNFNSILNSKESTTKLERIIESHNTTFRNEIIQLAEKLSKRESLRYSESGGGSNAMQYANGGIMDGSLLLTGNLSASYVSAPNIVEKKSFNIVGDGINSSFVLNHNFNSTDVMVTVFSNTTQKDVVLCYVEHTDNNNVTIDVGSIIPLGDTPYTAVIFS